MLFLHHRSDFPYLTPQQGKAFSWRSSMLLTRKSSRKNKPESFFKKMKTQLSSFLSLFTTRLLADRVFMLKTKKFNLDFVSVPKHFFAGTLAAHACSMQRPQTFVHSSTGPLFILFTRVPRDPEDYHVRDNAKKTSFHSKLRHFIQHLKPPEITVQFVGEKQSQIFTYIYAHALLKCRDSATRLGTLIYLRRKKRSPSTIAADRTSPVVRQTFVKVRGHRMKPIDIIRSNQEVHEHSEIYIRHPR